MNQTFGLVLGKTSSVTFGSDDDGGDDDERRPLKLLVIELPSSLLGSLVREGKDGREPSKL